MVGTCNQRCTGCFSESGRADRWIQRGTMSWICPRTDTFRRVLHEAGQLWEPVPVSLQQRWIRAASGNHHETGNHQSWCPANAPAPRGITQIELHHIKRIRWMPNPLLLVRLPWAIAWWWKFTTRLVVGSDIPTDWSACYFTIEKKLRNKCFGRMLYNRFTLASK